jgi:hypothetical protein
VDSRYVNDTEIRVVGMSRSGNHAIIGWILAQARGRTCFLNCAEPGTNPFVSARPPSDGEPAHRASYPGFDADREAAGELSAKDYLVHSYEDVFLRSLDDRRAASHDDALLGASRRRIDVLVLRDPFNLFASRLAARIGHVSVGTAGRIWCQHAREYLGLRRHLGRERVMVSYNDWASSREYRARLAQRLGFAFDDAASEAVPAAGGGSSFDGTALTGRAHEMRVFDRWRLYADDPFYLSVFTAPLVELAQSAFGWAPSFGALAEAA